MANKIMAQNVELELTYRLTTELYGASDKQLLHVPLVLKGRPPLRAQAELETCLASNPAKTALQFQQVCWWETEAGPSYVRFPGPSPID